jgi:hypothetical protein
MTSLLPLTPGLLALGLAGLLTACGNSSGPAAAPQASPRGQVAANDCRSPNAQSTQRGCRPVTRTIATQ